MELKRRRLREGDISTMEEAGESGPVRMRTNLAVILAIFALSLTLMAFIFWNFPELNE